VLHVFVGSTSRLNLEIFDLDLCSSTVADSLQIRVPTDVVYLKKNVYVLHWLPDTGQFKCMLFRMTALLVTSKDADRQLLQHLCIAPVRLFEESVMESAVACWEWLLAARSDLRAQVLSDTIR